MNELVAQLPDLERQARDLERKAQAIRQIINGVRALNGEAEVILNPTLVEQNGTVFVRGARDRTAPRGRDALRRVMLEEPERTWKVIEIKREVLKRGWSPSPKAVEAMVKKLREAGELVPVSYGHYRLAVGSNGGASNSEGTAEEAMRHA